MEIVGAQDASSSDSPCSYHVFLSFRGEDTRKTFTDHLYTALNHSGFRTFRDDDEIERGENMKFELQKAIQESRMSIVVFSKNYASSSWCLDELVMILKRRRTTEHVVLPVFYHVDPSHVRKQMESFEEAFTRHEERFHTEGAGKKDEQKGKIQEWRAALREAADLAGMDLQNQADGLDDVDQLDAILGMRDWLFQELFSWHAFGQNRPIDGFIEVSERVIQYCGGLPLAIKILGSSLSGKNLNVWKSQLEKLKAIPDYQVIEKLKISYDSLQDDHDKNLFLHVACFFVGMDEGWVVTILDGCDFYTTVGIQNLIDRCLLMINTRKKLVMHQLIQEMGKEIVRQESLKEPGERSRLCNHKDSFNVLRENTGTGKIEGLILDMNFLEDKYEKTVIGVNRKRHFKEFLSTSLMSNVGNSFKRRRFGIFSWQTVGIALRNSDKIALKVDAFARMHKLKLLQLKNLQVNGSFENFPKGLRWLCWHGFSLNSICDDFPLDNLVVLEMPYSNLQKVWEGTKIGTMDSLRKFNANGTVVSPLLSTTKEVKPWYSFIWPSLLKPRKSVEISWILNLSNNPICSLPNCIGGLTGLQILVLKECKRLQSLIVEQNLKVLSNLRDAYIKLQNLQEFYNSKGRSYSAPLTMQYNDSWENQFVMMEHCRPLLFYNMCDNIVEVVDAFKLEPIGNIDVEILNNLGLPNFGSMGSPTVTLSKTYLENQKKLPLQGCHEEHMFYAYLPESKIPTWFNIKNTGSSISFKVPSHFRIQALSVCSIYALSNNSKYLDHNCDAHTIINNTTKSLIWSHSPNVIGIPEADEDMMWLSYWKFENQLKGGDELNISMVGNEDFQVKEVGVHLVYKEQEEKSSQSSSGAASQLQFSLYGNVVPGNASTVHPMSKKVFRLGCHWPHCWICDNL
ncbi:unnamed protein product [Camellia sinensis]